jgi:hypothetical protein
MTTKVLLGGIAGPIRLIEKPESIQLRYDQKHRCFLDVIENGDPRSLSISRGVFEVLTANGMSYGT